MEKFTKGPWGESGRLIYGSANLIATAGSTDIEDWLEVEANAALIAAAPEMYEMLKDLAANYINSDCKISDIENLLAKARGE